MKFGSFVWYAVAVAVRTVLGWILRAAAEPAAKNAAKRAAQGIGLIYSFEAEVLRRLPADTVPEREQAGGVVLPFRPRRRTADMQRKRSEEWHLWRENNRMLFRSSA